MNVSVINRQKRWAVKEAELRSLTEFFLNKAGKQRGIVWGDVSVVLVNDAESRAINKAHLGHDYPTDVISFNFDPIPGDPASGACGEIIVNVEQAHRLGRRYGGVPHELALYIAHGCDHLAGEDDTTPAQRQRMRRRELRWLREAHGPFPLPLRERARVRGFRIMKKEIQDSTHCRTIVQKPLTPTLSLKGRGRI